jgi:hypothetical protein
MSNIKENVKQQIMDHLNANASKYQNIARDLQSIKFYIYVDMKDDRLKDICGEPYIFNEDDASTKAYQHEFNLMLEKYPSRFLSASVKVYPDSNPEEIFDEIIGELEDNESNPGHDETKMDLTTVTFFNLNPDGGTIASWIRKAKKKEGMSITFATNDEGDMLDLQESYNVIRDICAWPHRNICALPHHGFGMFKYDTPAKDVYNDVVNRIEASMLNNIESNTFTM